MNIIVYAGLLAFGLGVAWLAEAFVRDRGLSERIFVVFLMAGGAFAIASQVPA